MRIVVVTGTGDPLAGLFWSAYLQAGGLPVQYVLRVRGKRRRSRSQALIEAMSLFGPLASTQVLLRQGLSQATPERWRTQLPAPPMMQVLAPTGTQFSTYDTLNQGSGRTALERLRPDVLVSVGCPEILRQDLLELPQLAALNLHNGRLPQYRGQFGTFWELNQGESQGAVTLHQMVARVDRGAVLAQRLVPLTPYKSLLPILIEKKRVGAAMLAHALSDLPTALQDAEMVPSEEAGYWDWPTLPQVLKLAWRLRLG